jgi:hypothetical protein
MIVRYRPKKNGTVDVEGILRVREAVAALVAEQPWLKVTDNLDDPDDRWLEVAEF